MQYLIRLLLFFLPFCSLLSCTIEQRLHRPGYHIGWKKQPTPMKADEVKARLPIQEEATTAVKTRLTITDTADVIISHDRAVLTPVEDRAIASWAGEQLRETVFSWQPDSIPAASEHVNNRPERENSLTSGPLGIIYPVVLLTCLVAGLILLKTTPATGLLLLSIAGVLFVAPFLLLLIGWLTGRHRAKRKAA